MNSDSSTSSMFLFDTNRSGRARNSVFNNFDTLVWKKYLPSYPPMCPESTPCFDKQGNMYFASHDGCFYSLRAEDGHLRWMYKLGNKKTYGSPSISKERIVIASGNGFLFCFSKEGEVFWKTEIDNYLKIGNGNSLNKRIQDKASKLLEYLPSRGNKSHVKCWSSPLIFEDRIYTTSYGTGLHCFDLFSGERMFSVDMGFPRFHSSGPLLTIDKKILAVSQTGKVFLIDKESGKIVKKRNLHCGWMYNSWGNPSMDPETENIYIPLSNSLNRAIIICLDSNLNIIWLRKILGAVRGSVSIGSGKEIFFGDFNGFLYSICKTDGNVRKKIKISSAKRALWTTPSVDKQGHILITAKESNLDGKLVCLNKDFDILWEHNTSKCLSVPVVDKDGKVYFGAWDGSMNCISTSEKADAK